MAILESINPQPIQGNWRIGYSLDFHNIARKSERAETKTPVARALRLSTPAFRRLFVDDVASTIADLLPEYRLNHDVIVAVPASDGNEGSKILEICERISAKTGALVAELRKRRPAPSLNGIKGLEARMAARQGLYAMEETVEGKSVLVVDDVMLTGATLRTVVSLLKDEGGAANVDVITLTREGGILWADAVAENKRLHAEFSVGDGEDAYLSDGIWVTPDGSIVSR